MEKQSFESCITHVDDLIAFLKEKRHDFYHHFTTFSTLEKIIRSKTWRFAPGENKNDLHEYDEKNNMIVRKRLLSTSFSYGDEDNMAMWAMYCIPRNEAIRLTMTRDAIERLVQCAKNDKVCQRKTDDICLHDIVYYQGYKDDENDSNNMLICDHEHSTSISKDIYKEIKSPDSITGYIKNSAWKHEQESRLTLFLKKESKDIFVSIKDDIAYILMHSVVAFGPWTAKQDVILNKTKKINDLLKEQQIDNVNVKYQEKVKKDLSLFGKALLVTSSPFANKVNLRKCCPYENITDCSVGVKYLLSKKNRFE